MRYRLTRTLLHLLRAAALIVSIDLSNARLRAKLPDRVRGWAESKRQISGGPYRRRGTCV